MRRLIHPPYEAHHPLKMCASYGMYVYLVVVCMELVLCIASGIVGNTLSACGGEGMRWLIHLAYETQTY